MENQAYADFKQVMGLKEKHVSYISSNLSEIGIITKDKELSRLEKKIKENSSFFKNEDLSVLYYRSRSIACLHCNRDQGCTIRFTQRCNRDCFFCFVIEDFTNKVKPNISCFINDIKEKKKIVNLKSIAISGGEPFLYKKELFEFLEMVRNAFKSIYLRIYTNIDLVTEDDMKKIKEFSVNEFRISIKPHEKPNKEKLLMIHNYVPNVVIEIPVIPSSEEEMYQLLTDLNSCGITGINLVEFFFNGFRAEEFKKRGFKVFVNNNEYRKINETMPHFEYPIYGSKVLAYKMLLFAEKNQLKFFVNICSHKTKKLQYKTKNTEYKKRFVKIFYRKYIFDSRGKFLSYADSKESIPTISDNSLVVKFEYDDNIKLNTEISIVGYNGIPRYLEKLLKKYLDKRLLNYEKI